MELLKQSYVIKSFPASKVICCLASPAVSMLQPRLPIRPISVNRCGRGWGACERREDDFSGIEFGGAWIFSYLCLAMSDTKAKSSARAVFTDYLEERRLRKTPERFFILDRVMEMKDHFLVEDLCAVLDQESYHVSRATVYNTLDRLEDCGLVRRHQFGSQPAQYEKSTGTASHHHLVCVKCGRIKEVRDTELARQLGARRYRGFTTRYFALYVHGVCSKCQRSQRQSSKSPK